MTDPIAAFMQANGLAQPPAFCAGQPLLRPADGAQTSWPTAAPWPMASRGASAAAGELCHHPDPDHWLPASARPAGGAIPGRGEQWWRLADANGAMQPEAMTAVPGSSLRITPARGRAAAPFEA